MSRPTLVVHAVRLNDGTRVGLVVSGALGNAVTRNRVKRRLRHLAAAHVTDSPAGTGVVVRALPRAASDAADLATDLGSAWHEAMSRLTAADPMKHRGR